MNAIDAIKAKGIDPHVVQLYQVLELAAINLPADSPFWKDLDYAGGDLLGMLDTQAELAPALGPDWSWHVEGDPPCETCDGEFWPGRCEQCAGITLDPAAVAQLEREKEITAWLESLIDGLPEYEQARVIEKALEIAKDAQAQYLLSQALGDDWQFEPGK